MPKSKMSDEDILKREPYRNIVRILRKYSRYYDKEKKSWLTHAHLLYAFIDKKKLLSYMNKEKQEEIKKSFNYLDDRFAYGQKFEELYGIPKFFKNAPKHLKRSELKRGCIKNPTDLNDRLTELYKRKLLLKHGKPKHMKYCLSEKYFTDVDISFHKHLMDSWKPDSIHKDTLFKPLETEHKGASWLLCGLPYKVIKNLTEKERNELNQWLIVIEENLQKIMQLKYDKMKMNIIDYNKIALGKSFYDQHTLDSIGFYYKNTKRIWWSDIEVNPEK